MTTQSFKNFMNVFDKPHRQVLICCMGEEGKFMYISF